MGSGSDPSELEQLEADDPDAIKRSGEEVAPALREAVGPRAEDVGTGVLLDFTRPEDLACPARRRHSGPSVPPGRL